MSEIEYGMDGRPKVKKQRSRQKSNLKIISYVVIVVLLGLSFVGGMQYQKHKSPAASTAISTQSGTVGSNGTGGFSGGRRFGGQRPTIGTVSAISSTSITVAPSNGSSDNTTLSITSSTSITNNGQTAAVSDIKVGDTVLVVASTSNTKEASRILLNPPMRGGFGGGAQPQSAPDSSTDSTPVQTN